MTHRRREVSRVEGFSDAVFGFAVTLLVVSLEVPKTFDDLLVMMRGFPAFAASFAMLFQVWWRHYRFFRRYDLEDSYVIRLTGLLLFVVLFYVYPMKFLWSVFFGPFVGNAESHVIAPRQVPTLFIVYGLGIAAAYLILAALYRHAYVLREALALTPLELVDTRIEIYRSAGIACVALLSVAIAGVCAAFAPNLVGIAGYAYVLIGVSETLIGSYGGRLRARLRAQSEGDEAR